VTRLLPHACYSSAVLKPVRPMMATLAATMPVGREWSYEVKWDGYRTLLIQDHGRARLVSRNLKDLARDYPHIPQALSKVTGQPLILDGEIVALREDGRPSFQALQHRTARRSAVVFYAFDVLHFGDVDYCPRPLEERRRVLTRLPFAAPILISSALPGTPPHIEDAVRAAGLEGVVAKRLDSSYQAGIRSRDWLKVKFNKRQEFVVGGFKPTRGTFDSVLVGYYDGRAFFYAGKVRAGFAPRTRAEVWNRIEPLEVPLCPFVNLPNSTGKSHWGEGITEDDMSELRWVKPQIVIEVAFTEWTAGNNLRHASFVALRQDKPAREVQRLA
jgi:DNA ligase D-like protein (predicted ligase)